MMRIDRFAPQTSQASTAGRTAWDNERQQNKPTKESNRRRRRHHKRRIEKPSTSGGIFTSSSEEDQDVESGGSRSSNFSVKSYPRVKKRSAGDTASRHPDKTLGDGKGYMSDMPKNEMHTMRSMLRRDMQMMMNNMISQDGQQSRLQVVQDQNPYGYQQQQHIQMPGYLPAPMAAQQQPGYQTIPMTPHQIGQPQVQVPSNTGNNNYVLPFVAGCAVSCIGLSYLGLILYALVRP